MGDTWVTHGLYLLNRTYRSDRVHGQTLVVEIGAQSLKLGCLLQLPSLHHFRLQRGGEGGASFCSSPGSCLQADNTAECLRPLVNMLCAHPWLGNPDALDLQVLAMGWECPLYCPSVQYW
jgi:hypothetical protein